MARALRPAKHLTPAQIDAVTEGAERAVLVTLARATKRPVYLKGGAGPDIMDSTGRLLITLAASLKDSEIIARALLPDTDLNAGGVAYDQWLTAALVAATEYQFVNQQIRVDQVAAIFGVATLDAAPGIGRVRLLNGTSVVMAAWDTTPLWAAEDTIGYTDEYALWDINQTINAQLMPFLTKAGGERFILLGYIAEPKGTGPITK